MNLHIYKDGDKLAHGLAKWIAGNINLVLRSKERYSLVLSGGNTPRKLYGILAEEYAGNVDWQRVDFFWGDERYVTFEDERNNGKMALSALLSPLGIPDNHIYRIPTSPTPEEAALQYQNTLKRYLGEHPDVTFDLSLMGMGGDGHTLSVFPGSVLLNNETDWVKNVFNPRDRLQRISMLPAIVTRSAQIVFMVNGEEKADTLRQVLKGKYDPATLPSQLFRDMDSVMWFTDEAAASGLLGSDMEG